MVRRSLSLRCFGLVALLLTSAVVPLAAQNGRDLLVPIGAELVEAQVGLVPLGLIEPAGELHAVLRVRDARSATDRLVGSAQPATQIYEYDDGDFEGGFYLVDPSTQEPLFEFELAQRFRLSDAGTVEYAVVCMGRGQDDTDPNLEFSLNFYAGGDTPQTLLADYVASGQLSAAGTYACFTLRGDLQGLSLAAGNVWVAVSWKRATPVENTKVLMADTNGPGGGSRAFRARQEEDDDWLDWAVGSASDVKAYGIRLAVDHPEPDPDPQPDPDPDPQPDPDPDPDPGPDPPSGEGYTDCVPQTTPLVFDGDYRVRLCYETPDGEVGEGKGGVWASGESGLLWFFNSENAEVLVKVLNGCAHNGHRWVFVAPVTDVAFNLHVTDGKGGAWSHHNRQGQVATPARDTSAFRCD